MKNNWTAADVGLLRTRPQSATWYLAVHRPASVYSASILTGLDNFPLSALTLTPLTGNQIDVKKNMTLRVGDNVGDSNRGIIRVREDMSGSVVQIAEAGSGTIKARAGDIVTVMDQFLPWSVFNTYDHATSAWLNDLDETFTSQLIQYGPYVNMGPPAAGFKSGGNITIKYHAGDTWYAGDGTEHAASWVFADGTTGGTLAAASAPFTLNYTNSSPSGSYVQLRVWDTNGNSAIGRRLVFAFDDRTQPHRVAFAEVAGGIREGGYKTQIRVHSNAISDNFPDMAEVVIFEEASYGNTASSLGGNYFDRSNIVFRGWIDGKTVTINPFSGDVVFQAYTINKMMDRAYNEDVFLISVITPTIEGADGWKGASDLTSDRTAWNLLRYRSTISEITDFYQANGLASKIGLTLYNDLAAQSLWKQFSKVYREQGTYGYAAADMQSSLFGMHDAQIMGSSATLPLTEITKQERRDSIIIQERDVDENSEANFLSIASDIKVWVRSPGGGGGTGDRAGREGGFGYFGKKKEHARGMYADQQTMTQMVGNWHALLNSKFPKVKVPLSGNMRLDSVPQSRVSMSLSSTENIRGYSWKDKEFIPYKTRLTYNSQAGVVQSELEVEEIIDGMGGSAVTFPAISTISPEGDPNQEDKPDIPGDTAGDGFGTVYVLVDSTLGRTRDFSVSSPLWTSIGPSGGATFHHFILDPWHPATRGYLATDNGLYRSTNLNSAVPTWAIVFSTADVTTETSSTLRTMPTLVASSHQEGHIGVFYVTTNERAYHSFSENNGSTWTTGLISSDFTSITTLSGGLANREGGTLDILYTAHNTSSGRRIFKSTDKGENWTAVIYASNLSSNSVVVNVPYKDNGDADIVIWSLSTGARKSEDGGLTASNLDDGSATLARDGINSYTDDRQILYRWKTDNTFWISTNAGTSFTLKSATGISGTVKATGGFPTNSSQFYVETSTGIFVSVDGGDNFIDKTGDWSFGFTITQVTGGTIVPLWIE